MRALGGVSSHRPAGASSVVCCRRARLPSHSPPAGSNPTYQAGIAVRCGVSVPSALARESVHLPPANQALPSGATATSCMPNGSLLLSGVTRPLAATCPPPGAWSVENHTPPCWSPTSLRAHTRRESATTVGVPPGARRTNPHRSLNHIAPSDARVSAKGRNSGQLGTVSGHGGCRSVGRDPQDHVVAGQPGVAVGTGRELAEGHVLERDRGLGAGGVDARHAPSLQEPGLIVRPEAAVSAGEVLDRRGAERALRHHPDDARSLVRVHTRPGAAVGAGDHLPERACQAEPERVRSLRGTAQEQRKDNS